MFLSSIYILAGAETFMQVHVRMAYYIPRSILDDLICSAAVVYLPIARGMGWMAWRSRHYIDAK